MISPKSKLQDHLIHSMILILTIYPKSKLQDHLILPMSLHQSNSNCWAFKYCHWNTCLLSVQLRKWKGKRPWHAHWWCSQWHFQECHDGWRGGWFEKAKKWLSLGQKSQNWPMKIFGFPFIVHALMFNFLNIPSYSQTLSLVDFVEIFSAPFVWNTQGTQIHTIQLTRNICRV